MSMKKERAKVNLEICKFQREKVSFAENIYIFMNVVNKYIYIFYMSFYLVTNVNILYTKLQFFGTSCFLKFRLGGVFI